MKILAFTDTHGNKENIKNIINKVEKENPDLIICCGDLSFFGDDLIEIAKELDKLSKNILIIPGNHESEEQIKHISQKFKNIINLHKGLFEFKGFLFFGHGEGGFSSIDRSFENIKEKVKAKLEKEKPLVLVFHAPPHKTELDKLHGQYVGNLSYRKFIEETNPTLVLSGHIHENEGKMDKINKSTLINPGRKGIIIEIKNKKEKRRTIFSS